MKSLAIGFVTMLLAGALAVPATHAQKLLASYPSLTTAAALQAAQAALARCDKDGFTTAVAVVDRGGHALALLRNGLAGAHTVNMATGKAASRCRSARTRPSLPRRRSPDAPRAAFAICPACSPSAAA